MKIVAVVNQKGGVGKTTTAINLGAALGALERRVLLVDCDPQGNATRGLGVEAQAPLLYECLRGEAALSDAIRPTAFPGLEIVPSNRDLVGIEVEFSREPRHDAAPRSSTVWPKTEEAAPPPALGVEDSASKTGWEYRLRDLLRTVGSFDYVLLDCPPSLGHLTICSLTAADEVLVPLQCEYFALEGMGELLATLRRVRQTLNPKLEIAGIVLTMFDERTRLSKDVVSEVRRHFADRVFQTVVPRNIRLAEAPSHGIPVLQYDIKSRGAQAYLGLARELLDAAGDRARSNERPTASSQPRGEAL